MAEEKLAKLLETQKSLTEWLEDIKHSQVEAIRREDNDKRERLKVLNNIINLPFDKPTQFEAVELRDKSPAFTRYLKAHGAELCALRLIPKEAGLPKLRMRGKSVVGAYEWFLEQDIDSSKYRADFIPHVENNIWSTIFVVNKHGIQGEIITGGHHQLTQGFHETGTPLVFRYDFKDWVIQPHDEAALTHLKTLANYLHVPRAESRAKLEKALGASFSQDYLEAYFETTHADHGTWFIDYSPLLGKLYADLIIKAPIAHDAAQHLSGHVGSRGRVMGQVVIVPEGQLDMEFPEGAVLVCEVTTPDYVPLMQKACAIVTDHGGILSHAAIVARELKKPCIVGTGNATKKLKPGQLVLVDADRGVVTPLAGTSIRPQESL